jgi:hypothetical protein
MDLIFNDCSLDGQYSTIQEFLECLCENIIPCLEIAKRKKIPLFKSHETYSRKVMPDKTLHDLLNISGRNLLLKFKSQIASLQTEPYWNETSENSNCLFEAASRKASLLSFISSKYGQKNIAVRIKEEEKIVINAFDKSSFLEALSVFSIINLSNSFSILGFPRYVYEIRIKEPSNHIPHFHVLVDKKNSASVSLEDFRILKSGLSQNKWVEVFSDAISLIEQNKEDYLDIWFYYHPKS